MKTLILTVGLPRSGKSTWAKEYSKKHGYPIVNKDSIRLALHGQRFILEAEDMVHTITKIMVKALFNAGHDTIILDETNIIKERRDAWKLSDDIELWYKPFYVEISTLKQRAKDTNQLDLIEVIEKMANKFEDLWTEEKQWII